MSKYRRAAKVDATQGDIVDALRKIPGVTVAVGHDDILVGYQWRTYWYEIKNPETALKADGLTLKKGAVKKSQSKIRQTWTGHYNIVWSLDMILNDMRIKI